MSTNNAAMFAIAAETRPVWTAAEDRRRLLAISTEDAAAQVAAFRAVGLNEVADVYAAEWAAAR